MTHPDCIFCQIIAGKIPADKVYETNHHVAFRDIQPKAPVHLLVVPKTHSARLDEMAAGGNTPVVGELFGTAIEAAEANDLSDYRLVVNVGPKAGQEVFHTHVHVLAGWPERAENVR